MPNGPPGGYYPSMHLTLVFNDEEYEELLRQEQEKKGQESRAAGLPRKRSGNGEG